MHASTATEKLTELLGREITIDELSEKLERPLKGGSNITKPIEELEAMFAAPAATKPARKAPAKKAAAKKRVAKPVPSKTGPLKIRTTAAGTAAAAELMEFLAQYPVPAKFPMDMKVFSRGGQKWVRATTVDGELHEYTLVEYNDNLLRRSKINFGVDIFSEIVANKIVTLTAKLDGAPSATDLGQYNEKLFGSRRAWYYHVLQVGILIWAGEINPPSLDFDVFPERKGIETVTWRYRAVDLGFVRRIFENFVETHFGVTGRERRDSEDTFIKRFLAGEIKVNFGDDPKDIKDFTVGGRQGTEQMFRVLWEAVQEEGRKPSSARSARRAR